MKLLALLPVASALNILLSSTDSWVASNVRYLYPALTAAGHDVVYVGPLNYLDPEAFEHDYENYEIEIGVPCKRSESSKKSVSSKTSDSRSSGDFNHLSEPNQEYYKNIRKRNVVPRGAKNTMSKKDLQEFDKLYKSQRDTLINNHSYGQDPLNEYFWYVDSNPLVALAVAFDYILPTHHEDFMPDLVLIGPNEGLHLTPDDLSHSSGFKTEDLMSSSDCVHAMRLLAQFHNLPVVSVSLEDRQHVYFENEEMFNVEETYERSFKRNTISKNIEFVNIRVLALVESVTSQLTPNLALNVNFPSINHPSSNCFTNGASGPQYVQVVKHKETEATLLGKVFSVPQFTILQDSVNYIGSRHWKTSDTLARAREISEVEVLRLSPLFEESLADSKYPGEHGEEIRNVPEARALERCEIAVSVCDITQGNNLAKPALYPTT